jgi:hypothetical protein
MPTQFGQDDRWADIIHRMLCYEPFYFFLVLDYSCAGPGLLLLCISLGRLSYSSDSRDADLLAALLGKCSAAELDFSFGSSHSAERVDDFYSHFAANNSSHPVVINFHWLQQHSETIYVEFSCWSGSWKKMAQVENVGDIVQHLRHKTTKKSPKFPIFSFFFFLIVETPHPLSSSRDAL